MSISYVQKADNKCLLDLKSYDYFDTDMYNQTSSSMYFSSLIITCPMWLIEYACLKCPLNSTFCLFTVMRTHKIYSTKI